MNAQTPLCSTAAAAACAGWIDSPADASIPEALPRFVEIVSAQACGAAEVFKPITLREIEDRIDAAPEAPLPTLGMVDERNELWRLTLGEFEPAVLDDGVRREIGTRMLMANGVPVGFLIVRRRA